MLSAPHSVRARLTLWYTAILALVLITFSAISYVLLAREIRSSTDRSLANTSREFTSAFSNDSAVPANGGGVQLDFRTSDGQVMVFSPAGALVVSSRARWGEKVARSIAATAGSGTTGFSTVPGGSSGDGIRVLAVPIEVLGRPYTAVVARELDEQESRLRSAAHVLFLGIPLALLLAAGGGYVLARKSLAPVTVMSAKARQISAATLDDRIVVANERDELGFLATTLNDLLERLQRSFESQRTFMADASHELRTPVAIIQGEADVVLSRPDRTPGEYRESIEIIQTAARGLTRIVQNLFLLARTDAGNYPVLTTRFHVDEIIASCVLAMRSVAAGRNVDLTFEARADTVVLADEDLIHRMFLNLIDNAVKFTPGGGTVAVQSKRCGSLVEVRVRDSGPGIPQEDQPQIFERFFRGDRGKRRATDASTPRGAGLGLPIARWIAEAHSGTLVLEQSGANGSTFCASLAAEE